LLVLTNDGGLVHAVPNPTVGEAHAAPVRTTYRARVMGVLDEDALNALRSGVQLGGGLSVNSPAAVTVESVERTSSWVQLTLCDANTRQVRRMLHAVGSGVMELERIAIGSICLGEMPPGSWRLATDDEMRLGLGYTPRSLRVAESPQAAWLRREEEQQATQRTLQRDGGVEMKANHVDQPRAADAGAGSPVRINKALRATHSRRQCDALVGEGRVWVNGVVAVAGTMLSRGDEVRLDGERVDWERLNLVADGAGLLGQEGELTAHGGGLPAQRHAPEAGGSAAAVSTDTSRVFTYIKMWKRRGVVCTTDRRQRGNIIDELGRVEARDGGASDRLFPVGRLDADSTGLILLTSDGSIVNRLLKSSESKRKEYLVVVDRNPSDETLRELASGVVITTVAQRDGRRAPPLVAPTKPCVVERTGGARGRELRFVLQEGRNRQIRRMCSALGLQVVTLHRVGFAGVSLRGCAAPGEWRHLDADELRVLGVRGDAR
jgi:23S rRNA pseudouridine2604 synthase